MEFEIIRRPSSQIGPPPGRTCIPAAFRPTSLLATFIPLQPSQLQQQPQYIEISQSLITTMPRISLPKSLLPSRRFFTHSVRRTAFATSPAPPRLPPKEQEEFERLQRASTGAFSTPKPIVMHNPALESNSPTPQTRVRPQINQSPASAKVEEADIEVEAVNARVAATGKGEELHPDIRRGAKPEFEGERNPKTGEIGGPKNEPLRWGSTGERGDWSYNGRVTDF
jgi:hypothetical protein